MIQELIISGAADDKKLPIISKAAPSDPTSSPFLPTPTTISSSSTEPSLRCPRCNSSNTKFCYYNNYNLTQPRHFCKTCRRYWTKGGALRNVPIGGGCRKAKPPLTKPLPSQEPIARPDPESEPEIPTIWAAPPHSSQLLAILRASGPGGVNTLHCHNNPIKPKEEAWTGFPGLSFDPLGIGSLWRNDGQWPYMQNTVPLPAENNPVAGVQDLYQMLRLPATATGICSVATAGGGGGGGGATALETSVRGELGYWNPLWGWCDMSTTN